MSDTAKKTMIDNEKGRMDDEKTFGGVSMARAMSETFQARDHERRLGKLFGRERYGAPPLLGMQQGKRVGKTGVICYLGIADAFGQIDIVTIRPNLEIWRFVSRHRFPDALRSRLNSNSTSVRWPECRYSMTTVPASASSP